MRSKLFAACLIVIAPIGSTAPVLAQTFPVPGYFREMVYSPRPPAPLPDPRTIRDYVADGKLRMSLRDAMLILLAHSTEIHIDRLAINSAEFNLEGAFANFDPMMFSTFNAERAIAPTDSQLQGAPTLSTLAQTASFNYYQTVSTGTNINVGFSASKESTNSVYNFLNPYITGSLNFSVTQPLLKGNTRFINRAPILIAQRNLKQTAAQFEANVNDSIYGLVQAYWNVVQARESLRINQKSQDLAQASYDRDKHALDLGALAPLDIYQSEAQVANRKVAVIQSEYFLKSQEDQFRRIIGADQDPDVRTLELELVESPEPSGALEQVDSKDAVATAFEHRPELEALRQQIEANKIAVRVDHNSLLPNLSVQAIYQSYGLGGNQYNLNATPPALVSTGGLGDAFSQIGGFDYPTYGFTLTLNLPIKNHAAEANLGNDLVQRRRVQYQERLEEENITLDVATAVHQLELARTSLDASRKAYELSRQSLDAEERKYQLGAETIFFVLQAQTVLASAEANVLQAEINYQLACAAVDHATGMLLDHYKIEVQKIKS